MHDFHQLKFYLLIDKNLNVQELDNLIPFQLKDKLKIKSINFDELSEEGWLEINNDFSKYFYKQSNACNHIMNFSRFFIFKYFPEIERAIYLDWDMIVKGDFNELLESYNQDKFIVSKHCQNRNFYKCIFDVQKTSLYFRNINDLKLFLKKSVNTITNSKCNATGGKSFNAGFYIVSKNDFEENKLKKLINLMIKYQKKHNILLHGTQTILIFLTLNNISFVNSLIESLGSKCGREGSRKSGPIPLPTALDFHNSIRIAIPIRILLPFIFE